MDDGNYRLANEINLAVPAGHADKLISLGDGTSALLYLYALRKNGSFSSNEAALDLKRTPVEIAKAAERLRKIGLFSSSAGTNIPQPAEEMPEYTAQDIASRTSENGVFPVIVDETQRILGKTLSGADIKILFGIYDYLGLPAEVILLLVSHCVETTRERLGSGRLPTMRTIEKEAYVWFNREIMTLEQAEDYLRAKRRLSEQSNEIKQILQINGRNFSATEREYVENWLCMGFDAEAIALAYDKTVVKTGGLQWKYMNSILQSWHGKGLHTIEEINSGDQRCAAAVKKPAKGARQDDLELLKKILSGSGGK